MRLFILRHGQAEPQETTDAARNLTERGRQDVAAMIQQSITELAGLEKIWSSSLVRAQQTATIARDILLQKSMQQLSIDTTDLIVPEADPFLLFDTLQELHVESLLLVSHQPFVGEVINLLCGTAKDFYGMGTSSLCCIDCEIFAQGMASLRWLKHINE